MFTERMNAGNPSSAGAAETLLSEDALDEAGAIEETEDTLDATGAMDEETTLCKEEVTATLEKDWAEEGTKLEDGTDDEAGTIMTVRGVTLLKLDSDTDTLAGTTDASEEVTSSGID
jgi:hypothetical protein